jgi:CheY-like chemotaxis protein
LRGIGGIAEFPSSNAVERPEIEEVIMWQRGSSISNKLYSLDTLSFDIKNVDSNSPTDMRILIVDDSDTTRRIIRAIVESHEWTICGEANSGWAGVSQFEVLRPNLVIVDLAMPGLNGLEVAKRMSTLNPRVPVILFTVLDLEGLEGPAREAGVSAVVSKAQAWDLVRIIENAAAKVGKSNQWLLQ